MSYPVTFSYTAFDSTKTESFSHEKSDCAVRAMMTVTGSSYAEAHALLADRCGRKDGKGTTTSLLIKLLNSGEILGSTFERVLWADYAWTGKTWTRKGRKALKTVAKMFAKGSFYCLMRGHAFAIVDGALVDTWKVPAGSKVFGVWRVEKVAAPVVEKVVTTIDAIISALAANGTMTIKAVAAATGVHPRTVRAAFLYGKSSDRFEKVPGFEGRAAGWKLAA